MRLQMNNLAGTFAKHTSSLLPSVCRLEAKEAWPRDCGLQFNQKGGSSTETAIHQLADTINREQTSVYSVLSDPRVIPLLRCLLVYFTAGKRIQFFQYLQVQDNIHHGDVVKRILYPEDPGNIAAETLRDGLAELNRDQAVQRMFSTQRLAIITTILRSRAHV